MKNEIVLRKLYLCSCGTCFFTRDEFTDHLKHTKRWRDIHFAMDYNHLRGGFGIWLCNRKLSIKPTKWNPKYRCKNCGQKLDKHEQDAKYCLPCSETSIKGGEK